MILNMHPSSLSGAYRHLLTGTAAEQQQQVLVMEPEKCLISCFQRIRIIAYIGR